MTKEPPETHRRPLPMKDSPANIPSYQHSECEPGYDGEPPTFVTRREHPWVDGARVPVDSNFNINHSRLCFLFNNKRLEERQYLAGERLARDWEKSQMQPCASTVMVGNGASGGDTAADALQRKIDAAERYEAAVRALGRGADIVLLVVISNLTVGKAAAVLGFKSEQRAWGRFDIKLHDLADHYGM